MKQLLGYRSAERDIRIAGTSSLQQSVHSFWPWPSRLTRLKNGFLPLAPPNAAPPLPRPLASRRPLLSPSSRPPPSSSPETGRDKSRE
ncbi:unnamed protein product [Protopolystoma xenopodis]|uniref:Uncharacterized protein n=1 Tax=Protopolystoma xenopodis TaxID=117903 RepID=A0A448WQS7_9PLAT|nr:unnamed protein product [Protopolystoma xenopodis]